ncbi:hypothetical protein PV797_06475 [Clostridiaceae bacterium M8S5]|nr:hypothetical protein PV797_06475 [Clostridiaceae bacterium M8S5]
MKCDDFSNKMFELYNSNKDEEKKKLLEHLAHCDDCNREFNEMEEVFESLSNLQLLSPPSDLTNNIMNEISKINEKSKRYKRKAYRLWGSSLVAAGILISIVNISFADTTIESSVNNIISKKYSITRSINKKLNTIVEFITDLDFLNIFDN